MEIPAILKLVNLTLALTEDYDRLRAQAADSGWGAVVLIVAVFSLISLLVPWFQEWHDKELRRRGEFRR